LRRGPGGALTKKSPDFEGPSALPGGFGYEVAHLLLHFGGVTLGAGDAAGLVFRQTHDAHKLCPTLDAHIFLGGHGFLLIHKVITQIMR
jgi:hypothetical protein